MLLAVAFVAGVLWADGFTSRLSQAQDPFVLPAEDEKLPTEDEKLEFKVLAELQDTDVEFPGLPNFRMITRGEDANTFIGVEDGVVTLVLSCGTSCNASTVFNASAVSGNDRASFINDVLCMALPVEAGSSCTEQYAFHWTGGAAAQGGSGQSNGRRLELVGLGREEPKCTKDQVAE